MKLQSDSDTLVDLLRWRSSINHDERGYTFLDGNLAEVHLSYRQLDHRARAIAASLQTRGAPGDRALLQYAFGADFICGFFGCLFAGIIAVPAYPPQSDRKRAGGERLQAIARDAEISLVLTTEAALPAVEGFLHQQSASGAVRAVATDAVDSRLASDWREHRGHADDIAFLQYTSGSTSSPKGVMVTHANLLHNERMIQQSCEHDESSTFVGWLPLYHDMGLIGNVLHPLFIGSKSILMLPTSFLQSPVRWLRAISHYRAHTSGGPNFAYELCAQRISDSECRDMDLSSWTVAFNGAEPVRQETLDRFAHKFAPYGFRREAFYPCYGLAEASLIVTGRNKRAAASVKYIDSRVDDHDFVGHSSLNDGRRRAVVGCGSPVADTTVLIVDPETKQQCPADTVGEVWVASPSVARGYWRRPEKTAEAFAARLSNAGREPFLRTGDLGFMSSGELFITGRLQDLIIIRGQNHHPEDMEWSVQNSSLGLPPSTVAAFSIDMADEERVVILAEAPRDGGADIDRVARVVRQAIADNHELQVHAVGLVKAGTIPKTSSGKIQRGLCRKKFLADTLDMVAISTLEEGRPEGDAEVTRETLLALPADERGQVLSSYLRRRLSRRLGAPLPDVDQPINSSGVDSLAAVELSHLIQSDFGVSAPLSHLMGRLSIAQLADWIITHIDSGVPGPHQPMATGGEAEYPLSYGQRALWFIYRLSPESPAYNIARAVRLRGQLNAGALRRALESLATFHPVLRNTFEGTPDGPIQSALPDSRIWLQEEDAFTWTEEGLIKRLTEEANRPFDLGRGPVMRVHLFRRSPDEQVLMLSVHHIVADLWSFGIILRDLEALYHSPMSVESPGLLYADYVRWQADFLAAPEGAEVAQFWERTLSGDLPVLDLPTDSPGRPAATDHGARVPFQVSAELLSQLKAICRANGCTLFTLLLSVLGALLHRYSGQEEILIAMLASGRDDGRWADVVGYFVNLVVLRSQVRGTWSFRELLGETQQIVLAALEHGNYPFPLLAERAMTSREGAHSPMVRVMLAFQKAPSTHQQALGALALGHRPVRLRLDGCEAESIPIEPRTSLFDLSLMIAEADGGLEGVFEYSTDLFRRSRMERMANHFTNLLAAVAADAGRRVYDLPLLTDIERQQLLRPAADPMTAEPGCRTLHEMFEEQAMRTPGAIAVIANSERWTYEDLNRRANQVARRLRALGARAEMRVGVCMSRSAEMLVALLGVLKAGSAYVPADPDYPPERIRFIFQDSQVAILLTEMAVLDRLPRPPADVVVLDRDWPAIAPNKSDNLPPAATDENLAYVIYTSGSTGPPKGVQITHANVTAFLDWVRQAFQEREMAGALASSSICFDLSVFEVFGPLTAGGSVVMAENLLKITDLPDRESVTLVNTVPSLLAECLKVGGLPASVRTVALAGEPFPLDLARQIHACGHVERVLNLYAPSETTTYSTWYRVERDDTQPPCIGSPIGHTQVFLLDGRLHPVPQGIRGELYIAGSGVARGYLDRPDLTAERFLPNPFSPRPGRRMYKTGDLAFYREDGQLEFVGRVDRQIKLRGFRIEPGEVEVVLSRHPGISASAVIPVRDEHLGQLLCAYLVARPGHSPGADEMRNFAAGQLPRHMVPAFFVFMDALPLSSNGKLDVRALPRPSVPPRESRTIDMPRTALEQVLAERWAAFLGLDAVGIDEDFFALGGHSLIATQLAWDLERIFPVNHSLLSLLLKNPTVARLGDAMRHDGGEAPDLETVAEVYLQVRQFTEDEIESLARSYEQSENGSAAQ
jgi:amino acid adenylation domain-containing protein